MDGRIFICYRHGDSPGATGRLFDQLRRHFDRDQVFMDVDTIEPGVDFIEALDKEVATCAAFLAVIGPGWANARTPDGKLPLDNPNDYVRVEIEAALKRDIRLIPVLVNGASMPNASDLPPPLQGLARYNAFDITHRRFASDCDDLALKIKRALGVSSPVAAAPTNAPPPTPHPPSLSEQVEGTAGARLSWPQILFSFRGRIARRQFLLGMIFTVVVFLALFVAIDLAIKSTLQDSATKSGDVAKLLPRLDDRLGAILDISLWWPTWALTSKRLHDLGLGWTVLLVFICLDIIATVLGLRGEQVTSDYINVFAFGLMFMLGAVKGMAGTNKYGPDPLARPSRPS